MSKRQKKNNKVVNKTTHVINNKIRKVIEGVEVKLVTDDNQEVITINEALKVATDNDMDLVLVGAKAKPPIVKMMDYSKFLYEKNKNTNKNKTLPMKEMRFRPNTSENDLAFKTKHIIGFLEKGHKVKAFVFFKGREKAFKEKGEKLLLELAMKLEDYGVVERMPKFEGNKMTMFFKPKKDN